jgi:hypothetical protein
VFNNIYYQLKTSIKMKNYKILAAVAALTMVMNANAINTINLGDDIRISPRYLDGYYRAQCRAEFDGMCDSWTINVTYPQGLTPKLVAGVTRWMAWVSAT